MNKLKYVVLLLDAIINMKFSNVLLMTLAAVLCSWPAFGAIIEIPDDLLEGGEGSFVGHELLRSRREANGEVVLNGQGGNKEGYVKLDVAKNLHDDGKNKLDLSASGQSAWSKDVPTMHGASVRLDGDRQLWSNGQTSVYGTGFAKRNVGTGMRPQDSFGAGAEVRHTLAKGRDGSLEAFAAAQRQWNTPNRNQYNAGIRWTF